MLYVKNTSKQLPQIGNAMEDGSSQIIIPIVLLYIMDIMIIAITMKLEM